MEENEQINSDENTGSSSETQNQSVEGSEQSAEGQEASAESSQETKQNTEENLPFHQHPRFKELVEQKNQFATQAKTLEEQLVQMRAQIDQMSKQSTSKAQEDALIARLKGIDPEFGERIEKLDTASKELEDLREWRRQMEADSLRTQAFNKIKDLHTQNKVSADMQGLYQSQLEAEIRKNPQARLEDLDSIYKGVHDNISKLMESVRRSERESYVKGKAQDSKAPTSQPKGKAVNHSKESEFSNDPAEARQQLISRVLKEAKTSNSI